ncbi:MAG: metallophosphoesterase, partial [Acidobacteriota bacterium]|nr:metallophosphoesterase [Acidobacteriota bacterium]
MALYSGEVARHWLDVTEIEIKLNNLPEAFNGVRIAQMSDIHMGEFTEEFFLRQAVATVNSLRPDIVLLTGDFVTKGILGIPYGARQAAPCAEILSGLACKQRFAVLGNHDVLVDAQEVVTSLTNKEIPVLRNAFVPLEREGARIWLAGLDDVLQGEADPELAIPAMIRNQKDEPVVLMCHEPDYVYWLMKRPVGQAVSFMLSG